MSHPIGTEFIINSAILQNEYGFTDASVQALVGQVGTVIAVLEPVDELGPLYAASLAKGGVVAVYDHEMVVQ